jgi:negative regulator of sigma E activity
MTRDELEFAISQYLDGNLAEAEESALEARLASDADARALLAEYRSLDRVLRAAPPPTVDWDALSGRVSKAVAREAEPAQSYRLHWVRTAAALALAACVVVAVSIGIRRLQGPDSRLQFGENTQPATKQIVVIDTARRAAPSTAPVAIVSVGPPAAAPDRAALARYHEDLISRPSQVIIARSGQPAQDGSWLP